MKRLTSHRRHTGWAAFAVHRLSGIVLAAFLPLHFLVLSLALTSPSDFDAALAWSDLGLVKLAETGLVAALAVHLLGGIRILVIEFTPASARHAGPIALAVAGSLAAGLGFALNAW